MRKAVCIIAVVACFPIDSLAEKLDQAALLRRMIDLDRLADPPPVGEITGMFSSYDRKSKVDRAGNLIDWNANADWGQFIRTEDEGWSVMAEMDGPGVITRIWSANPSGQIRFILDGKTVIDAPFENLFNGQLAPFRRPLCYMIQENGGKNCYFPIGFSKSCKVVIRQSKSYYQINYMLAPDGDSVVTFKPELDEDAEAALSEVEQAWDGGLDPHKMVRGDRPPLPTANEVEIKRRKSAVLEQDQGSGTIRALQIALSGKRSRELYALHKCILRIYFDGSDQPSVEAPLADFFGSGFSLRPFISLVTGTAEPTNMPMPGIRRNRDQVFMYCYFPMPFKNGFRIEIENLSDKTITFLVKTLIDRDVPLVPDPDNPPRERLRFNARFRKVDPCKVLDYSILETEGRGRIVGCVLNVDCPRSAWWGEGDDKVWIDGERFPSYFGTGSEDYLGDAWGLREHVRPQQGVTLKRPYGKNSAYRWHIFDCINFQKSVKFTIENWQFGGHKDTYYSTIAYWYGQPGAAHKFKPLKAADLTLPGLRIPNSIEIEGDIRADKKAFVQIKEKYVQGNVELSGGLAVRVTTSDPVKVNIASIEARTVLLSLRVNPRQSFDSIEIAAPDGSPLASITYQRATRGGIYPVGTVRLQAGDNLFGLICRGKPTLDCWIAEPVEVRSPYAIEAEVLRIVGFENTNHETQRLRRPKVSGGAHVWCKSTEPGAWIEFELPRRKPGKYKLSVVYTTSRDYGIVQTHVNGKPVGEPFDTFGKLELGPIRELGTFDLISEPLRIKCELTGKSEQSPGYYFGVDCFILEPVEG